MHQQLAQYQNLRLEEVYNRIDVVLNRNRKLFWILVGMSTVIFLLGVIAFGYGVYLRKWQFIGAGGVWEFTLWRPVKVLIRLRREDISLAVAPVLIAGLPAKDAAVELRKLLGSLRSAK